ncbi:NAD-dependent succinate-semialdehyde dehydrogenase [Mycolicibacterium conceptionense]|jgi:succinate-semialdehyde dehydrogenase/glutarate-semialdehyde dehydrogenase|uniref:Succinate-semialdehyde dehydrogenase n=3 Tax=Mycolicibacterium TaxID=1866885 RepID=A0A0J8UET8_9MYCO|nr:MULTISPECIES: NAD-dependent succinate-semialdehyde dehydrogenase [Mycolicibacterium]KLI06663.1 succinate-semialdehyde dehydrogenase [Mycolicibacterium senegalense]KLO53737.1 succinate-semialdehyde dehydrogenase [Mycolicibacterium senegalense]KMV20023.1 succinate-semialdehyde dehydrogenase [Mycolicibacterium conceptionense]MCW1824290.1 NAD-dependent succinate-semialdehyde dehydrogenase [Mycolicibacterium senegalense]OBB06827.1 NAD-dependent succinate-semialdehyde dehydrogenase [Mycolicibacte
MAIEDLISSVPTGLWIGGEERQAAATFNVLDPSDDQVLATVADATAADAVAALDAACAVQAEWAATAPRKRGEILRSVFEKITERADDIAALMTLEMGKVLAESKGEVAYGAEFFRWFSEEAVRIAGRFTPAPAGTGRILVTKQAVGPCYAITPWNFPLAMGTRKMGPAFAAGCTMIVKPAQETPLTMLLLAKLMDEAGLPKGVLSVLPTSNPGVVTSALIDDGRLRKLTFTGSTGVGKALVKQSADKLLRTSMELGGNAPFIVFDDADVDAAVDGAILAKMRNGGEACTAANRFHVANSVREEFTDKLVKRMSEFTLGKGIDPSSTLGPLINSKQVSTVTELVSDAVSKGATVAVGGVAPGGPGNFYPATVLADVPADARILKEEVFGPVAPITGFDTEDEGVAAANNTEYGLAAYVYTQSLDRALRVAEGIQSGMVGINRGVISDAAAPFGGIKESGFGREGGIEGIEEYLDTKYIALTR